jgi:hypothetical protein
MELVATTLDRTGAWSWPPLAILVGVASQPPHPWKRFPFYFQNKKLKKKKKKWFFLLKK